MSAAQETEMSKNTQDMQENVEQKAQELQDALMKAMKKFAENSADSLKTDKTITATIVSCDDATSGEHLVNYQGGNIVAYSQDGASYDKGTSVYVLVPEGNFSNTKYILGLATATKDGTSVNFVSTVLDDYDTIGDNAISPNKDEEPFGLHSYKVEDFITLYEYSQDNSNNNLLEIDQTSLQSYMQEAEAIMIESDFYTRLPQSHQINKTGIYGLLFNITFKKTDIEKPEEDSIDKVDEDGNSLYTKNYSFVLDTNRMVGNPYGFTEWINQYDVFPIDNKNFVRIEQIIFFSYGFEDDYNAVAEIDDETGQELTVADLDAEWGADIFCKQLGIYAMKMVDDTSSDYRLKLSALNGAIFKDTSKNSALNFLATFKYRGTDITDSTTFYWFQEDSRITYDSPYYQMYAGNGWKRIAIDEDSDEQKLNFLSESLLTVTANNNRAYENKYLCIAVYQETIILRSYFTIYNESCKRKITIESNLGKKFSFDRGTPTLTCLIDGKSENFSDGEVEYHPDTAYKFVWNKIDNAGQVITFTQTELETKNKIDELEPQQKTLLEKIVQLEHELYEAENNENKVEQEKIQAQLDEQNALLAEVQSACTMQKNILNNVQGVFFGLSENQESENIYGNILQYPVFNINNSVTFRCNVFVTETPDSEDEEPIEYSFGSAEITLLNDDSAEPTDYYIIIENGDQVFQYSESGVSPANDRYQDPLEILPLRCHFFDPAGLEVDNSTYSVMWKVPIEDSLINITNVLEEELKGDPDEEENPDIDDSETDTDDSDDSQAPDTGNNPDDQEENESVTLEDSLELNPATGKKEYFIPSYSSDYLFPLSIKESYDFQALNNQVECIVKYQDKTWSQSTSFLFTKVGENGTNGTDIVAKIDVLNKKTQPIQSTNGSTDMLALHIDMSNDKQTQTWNVKPTRKAKDIGILEFLLYQRYQQIDANGVVWSISGTSLNSAKSYLTLQKNNVLQTVNIQYNTGTNFNGTTIKPEYHTQIIKAETTTSDNKSTYYAYYPIPIIKDHKTSYTVAVDDTYTLKQILYNADCRNPQYNKNQGVKIKFNTQKERRIVTTVIGGIQENWKTANFNLIANKDDRSSDVLLDENNQTYTITTVDQEVLFYILPHDVYSGEYTNNVLYCKVYDTKDNSLEKELWIPIHMQLNVYGLASLNSWDGNSIQIAEDEGYILAPQIGAGEKDAENKFTGLVMGTGITTVNNENASNAIGLIGYNHGQQSIWLDAETGNATFGLNSNINNFQNMPDPNGNNEYQHEGRIELRPTGISSISRWHFDRSSLYSANIDGVDLRLKYPSAEESTDGNVYVGDSKYTEDCPEGALTSIPHYAQGILLNSNPAYISIKGRQLTYEKDDNTVDFANANTTIVSKDTFEAQLDPNSTSLFTIYRHTAEPKNLDRTKYTFDAHLDDTNPYVDLKYNNNTTLTRIYLTIQNNTNVRVKSWMLYKPIPGEENFFVPEPSGVTRNSNTKKLSIDVWSMRAVEPSSKIKANANILYTELKNEDYSWYRTPIVGIDAQGRFYSNAVRDQDISMTVGKIGAFGYAAGAYQYVGAAYGIGGTTLVKFFTDVAKISDTDSNLYISGSTDVGNEYQRPIKFYGKSFDLYASSEDNKTKLSNCRMSLSTSGFHTYIDNNNYISLNFDRIYLRTHNDDNDPNIKDSYLRLMRIASDTPSALSTTDSFTEVIGNNFSQTVTGTGTVKWQSEGQSQITVLGSLKTQIGSNSTGDSKDYILTASGNISQTAKTGNFEQKAEKGNINQEASAGSFTQFAKQDFKQTADGKFDQTSGNTFTQTIKSGGLVQKITGDFSQNITGAFESVSSGAGTVKWNSSAQSSLIVGGNLAVTIQPTHNFNLEIKNNSGQTIREITLTEKKSHIGFSSITLKNPEFSGTTGNSIRSQLANKNVLSLNSDDDSYLGVSGDLYIQSHNNMRITSAGGSLKLRAIDEKTDEYHDDDRKGCSPFLLLSPATNNASYFNLYSAYGSMRSNNGITRTGVTGGEINGVYIDPALDVPYIHLSGGTGTYAIEANKAIFVKNIGTASTFTGELQAQTIGWTEKKTGTYDNLNNPLKLSNSNVHRSSYTNDNIWNHINNIYYLLDQIGNYYATTENVSSGYATKADLANYATKTDLNSYAKTTDLPDMSKYVTKTTYEDHKHYVGPLAKLGRYTFASRGLGATGSYIDADGSGHDITGSIIKVSLDDNKLITGKPDVGIN